MIADQDERMVAWENIQRRAKEFYEVWMNECPDCSRVLFPVGGGFPCGWPSASGRFLELLDRGRLNVDRSSRIATISLAPVSTLPVEYQNLETWRRIEVVASALVGVPSPSGRVVDVSLGFRNYGLISSTDIPLWVQGCGFSSMVHWLGGRLYNYLCSRLDGAEWVRFSVLCERSLTEVMLYWLSQGI